MEAKTEFLCYDSIGKPVHVGDKIRGEGFLVCSGNYKIDLTPEVTASKDKDGNIFFGHLSKSSFRKFYNTAYVKENPLTF